MNPSNLAKIEAFLTKYSLTKEKLEEEYNILGSVLEVQIKYPYEKGFHFYYRLFKHLGISVSVKQASNNNNVKNKRKQTSLNKYGYEHNFSKNHPSRLKWEKELLEREGITNVFQREEVKKKSLETLLTKYGVETSGKITNSRGKNIISSLNKRVFDILKENNIDFLIEHKIPYDDTYYAYDVLIEPNKLIEVNGDYWHGNPKIYKATDIILKGSSKEVLVESKWEHDKHKIEVAINNGYQILTVWEYDLKNNYEHIKKEILIYAAS